MKTWQQARSESGRKGNGWTACGAEHQPTGPAGQEGPRRGGQRGGQRGVPARHTAKKTDVYLALPLTRASDEGSYQKNLKSCFNQGHTLLVSSMQKGMFAMKNKFATEDTCSQRKYGFVSRGLVIFQLRISRGGISRGGTKLEDQPFLQMCFKYIFHVNLRSI